MKTFLQQGFLYSRADRLAIENDLLETLEEWAMKGPYFHMTGKPVKAMKAKWMGKLQESKAMSKGSIPANYMDLVTEIKAMSDFAPEKRNGSGLKKPKRTQARDEKILTNGMNIENHEHEACVAYWEDPEGYLVDLLDNKIAACKSRMIKEWTTLFIADPTVASFPSDEDELIEFIVARPEYKNRVQREAESLEA